MNFEVKSRRTIVDNKGNDKSITEVFLVENAESFGEAENRVEEYWNSENDVVGIAISKVIEVLNYPTSEEKEGLRVFKAVFVTTFTDDDGNDKEQKYPVVLWAHDIDDAMVKVAEHLKQGYGDITLIGLAKSKIVEVI